MDQQLAAAVRYKAEATQHLQAGDAKKALFRYNLACFNVNGLVEQHKEAVNPKPPMDPSDPAAMAQGMMPAAKGTPDQVAQALELYVACRNNAAQAAINLQDWAVAYEKANEVLELSPGNAKALYRRGLAALRRHNPEQAEEDLARCVELNPGDAGGAAYFTEAHAAAVAKREKQKQAYKGMFGGGDEPAAPAAEPEADPDAAPPA